MSFLCSCAGRRRKRDGSDDRQEYYRRRSRSASRTPPLASAAPAATPKVKRKFPSGIAPTPSVPSDLEDNSAAAVAAAKKNGKNAKAAAKVRDPAAKLPFKVTDPKLKTTPKVTDVKRKDSSNIKGASNVMDTSKIKDASNIMDVSNTKDATKDEQWKPAETRTMGTMTAPGAGEVTGYEQTIVPRARGRSPPAVAAKMEVTLRSMRRPGPLVIAPPLADDACGSSGSDTPTRGYEASVSSSDAACDAQTQCAFSDFSDDESSLLSLGREEGEYESTVSELRDASPGASGQEVWDPGFLQHDRIWMDIKSTLMDLISDKDSPAFHELHESMKPPDLTYCTVFRKLDGTVTHKAREDKKKARHSFGGVPADKVPGSRSKLNLIALRDEDGAERGVRRKVRDEGDGMEYEDLTPTSEYDDKLFTPDDEVTEYYFGRRTSSEPDVPLQTSQPQLAPDAKITEFYFGRGTTSDLDIPLMKSDSQITLRSFQGGTTSEALRSSMSAIWPAPTRDEKIGGSAVELTVPRTETDLPDKKEETITSEEGHPGTELSPEITQNVPVAEVPKVEVRLEERDVPAQSATEVETVTNEPVVDAAPEVKMRPKITSKPFDRSLSESSSRVVREGTPVAHDLKTQKELWRQGVAFEGKDFDIGDAEIESMEVEPVSPEPHENNRHHPKRVTRRKETSQLRSFSLDYEKRSPKVVRKRPGRPIVVQPYSSTRVSLPPAKDHSKHKLKLKHEDRIDDPSSSLDDAGTDETADETPDFEPALTKPAVASDREVPKDTKSSTPEKSDSSLAPTGILESPSELKSPSMVRSVTTGRFKVETKQPSENIKDSQNIDPNRKKSKSPDDEPASHMKSEPQTTVSQTTQKIVSKIPVAAKPKKHQQPSLFPTIDAESRFVSKPSEVKRSGKIELIDPPTDEEESEETKARRAKKTRNVGRFLPRGGLKELKTADIPQEQADIADSGREIKKQESESSTTEPDLVIGHGSPHGSVDAQLLKFGNSLDESVSKGSPDVIVQCFGEVSAASEDKNQFEVPPESRSCDDFKTRDNTFEKSATLFSAASTSVETVISALKSGSDLLEDDGLGSMDIDDVENKTELETANDIKDGKGSIEEAFKEDRTVCTQTLADVGKDSLGNVASTIRENLSLESSNNVSPKTPDSVERKKLADPIVRGVEIIPSGSLTGNGNITRVKNDVDSILMSLSSEPSLKTRVRSESAEKEKSQIPVTEARRSEIEVFAPSGDSQSRVTSPESPAAFSDTSSGSFPEDLMPLLSPVSSSPPETSPRSPSEVITETSLPGSGCTSPKRISSGSDSVHPLPKVETTVDQTPLGSRPPETTTATTITTTTKTPRVRLSDIVITGSGEEKLLALSTSPVNDVFLTDVSADRQSTSVSPAFDQAVSPKQDDATGQRSRPPSDVFPKPIGPVSSTSQPLETSSSPPLIPDPSVSTSNTGLVETGSSTDKILGVLDIGGAPVRNESVPVVATSQSPPTEDALGTLAEKRDSFLPSERDTKRWTPSEANLYVSVVSDANDETVKPDEEVKTEVKKKTESEESKEKSPESSEKSGKTGAKVKKGVKKDGKADKKGEKGDKKSKTKASAKVELPPFPPPDRPIRIAVRPSERIRALSKASSASSTATRTSDSSDAVETSSDRESITTEGSISKEVVSAPIAVDLKERDEKLDKAKEAGSATEQTRSGANERFSTDSIPTDSFINSSPVLVQTGETFKSTEKVDDVRDSVTALVKDIIEIESNVGTDSSEDKAESRVSGADAKEPVKTSNISPDRDSLDETSKSAQRTPRDSLEKEIPQEITDVNLVSPLPSPKDSLDTQSRRDSELTIDSLHRDSLSDAVNAKSQSPCDSLDENISKVVSESVQPDPNVMGVVTPLSSPRDSLESSPTKSLQEVGKIKRASTVKSIDDDQILSFSSIWSPRISMQQASERVTSPVSETVVSQSAKIVDARPFLAPLFSAENQTPPWISDAVPEPGDSVPIRSPPRDSFEDVMSEPPVSNVQSHPLLASTSPNMSPIASQRASLEEGFKLTSKQLDRTASSESTQRDDVSSISSVTSPRDSLSSKRESSTTISDSRLSTTDTSVIDDILGVGSIALPKEWSESAPGTPQRTSLRASLAVEEVLSSSSATSPRDSFEETPGSRVIESPKLSQIRKELRKDTGASFSLQSTPRDSLDFGLQTKPAESIPNTPHRESLIDSVHTAGTAASRTGRDSFDSEKSSSPRISQKDITESFHKYFSSLDPKLAGLRDSKMSSGSGDSRRSAASDSDFDIIDFTEPDLVVLTDLPEEHSTSEPGLPTPKSNSTSVTPRPDRTQSVLSGGFDIMYIDTSSFDDDKTPKVTSESESSPTREVAKVMEELASVLENAEKAFDTDTSSASNKSSDTPVPARGDSPKAKVPNKHIPGSTEVTEKEDVEKQLEKDHDMFRKIAESSMDIGFDVEASFEAMVNSILTPRSSGIIDEGTKEEAKDAPSSNVSPVTDTSDKKKSKQNVGVDPKRDTAKPETKKDREFSISEKNKPIVKDSPVPSAIQCKEAGDKKEKTSPKDTDPKREGVFKDPEDKVPNAHKGETGIRESTFGLAKKVKEILRRTPSAVSQTEECSKISTSKTLSKTSSVEVTDPVHASTNSEYSEKRIADDQRPEVAVEKHCQQLQDSEELEPNTGENLLSPDSKSNMSGEESLQYANKDPNEVIKPSDSLKDQILEKIGSAVQELRPSGEILLEKDTATVNDPDKSDFSAEKRDSPVQPPEASDLNTAIPEQGVSALPEEILSQERKKQLEDSSQIPKGERDSNISVNQSESESEKSEMVKPIDNKSDVLSSIDSQTGADKLNVASERQESTIINEKSPESSTELSEKEKTVQTDVKKQTKTKSKSLSREKTDSYDAFSVAVEKNIPLPPDSEPLETEHERNLPDKEREELHTTDIGTILQQPKLDNLNENLQNVMPSEVDLKEKEGEKETEKRRAGDWSKSFSLESQGSQHTFGDVKEKLLTDARPDVKRTISSESALEKKTHKNTKGKLVSKSFSRNSEDGTVVSTESENKEPISLEAKPLLMLSESIINQAEDDISQINKSVSKSGSESHEGKEKDSTEVKEDHSQNKEVPDSEHIQSHVENKTAIPKPSSKTEISKEKGDDSGVEDDATQDHSEYDVATQEKKQSSKKPKSRSREDINSEELADLIQKQLSIAGGQVDDSQPEWTGPIRREKKSRKSVKTSKSRSVSTEENDAQSDSSIVLPDSSLTHVEPTEKCLTGVETGSPEDTPQMPVLRRFKSKSKSREDKTLETPQKDLPSSPESSREESSSEKPKSILKSSSKEKVPVESPPSSGEIKLSQEHALLSFGDPFSIHKADSATDVFKRSDSTPADDGVSTSLSETLDHLVTSTTFEKSRDQSSDDVVGDRKSIRKIKSRSSSREDEYPMPDSSFDEKFVTSITESKPREATKELTEFGFSEPRSPRSLRRRSSSKSVSFEDDVILESVEDELAEAVQSESTESKEDFESSTDKSRKSKLERRKSPKKKSKSRPNDQDLVFDSSFEAIPEDSPIFTENTASEEVGNVESYVKELSDSRDKAERSKSKSKNVTPDKTIPSETDNTPLIQIEPLDTQDGEKSIAIEEEKCKIERRKSPKKKSKSKSYDHDDVPSSSVPRHLIEERSLRYVVTPDRELGPTVRNLESLQKESIPEVSTTDAAESGSDFDSFIKERSSKSRIERRKSPKKKSKPKIPSTDEEDITSSEILIARVDEYFSSISGTDSKGSEGDLPDHEKQFSSLERRKSPKKKSKSKSAENEQIPFGVDATVFENTSVIAKDEQLVDSNQAQEGSDIFGEPLGENWLQQPKIERRKSPKKKSKSKSSTQESVIPKPSPSGGDFFLPTVPAFQIDKSEGVLETSKEPPLTSTEGTQSSDLGLITSTSQTEDEIARDPMTEDKPFKTKSKPRSKPSDLESNRTIEKSSSTHSQSEAEITDSSIKEERRDKSKSKGNSRSGDEPGEKSMTGKEARGDTSLAEKGEAALIFENAATIRTENISSAGGTTRVENIQPGGAASLDRIIVTQDSTENVRLSSGSLMYPKAIDFFTTITSSRPESIEGQFPLSLPPSRTSLELLAQKSTESLSSNVSWNFPPKVDVRTMFVGNVTSPSKADDETAGLFPDPSTGEPVSGIRPSDSSNSVPGSNPLPGEVTSTKSLSFEDALRAYREKNKKSEDASIPEGRSKPLVLEGTSAISGGSSELAKSRSIEATHTTVPSPTEQEQGIAALTKPYISRTSSASTDKVVTKTSRSFEKSFEIPGSMEIFDKESTSAVAASHSKPASRVNSTTSEKSVAKTQSFEISIEQPVSWDVEHLDLEQSPSVVSGSKPISRSSSTSEAMASVETDVREKENVTSKPSLSKPQSRTSSNASDKSVSKSLEPVQKDIEQTTSWEVASFEADSTSMITRSKPISRSSSMASEKGVVKAKGSFDNVFRQTSTSDVEVSENQPSSPVILRNKPPSRSSSTTSEKSISKPTFSFDEGTSSKSEDTTAESTPPTENIASESGVPIAVCAPLRWSAALPENIDLTHDPTAEQVKQRAEEKENIFQPSVAPQEQPPAARVKSTSSDHSGDKTDVPHIGVQKEANVNYSETKASVTQYPERKANSNTQELSATPKSSPVPRKKTESIPNVAPASESTTKTPVQQTRIPSARSSPAPQKKSPTTESKSTLQDTKIPSARSSPAPQKKTTSSESRSESSQENRPTATKPSPVPQKKSQPKSEKTDAKSSPIPQKKSQLKSEKTDADGRRTAAKSSPAAQRKTQPKPETSNAEARPTAAKSSPAPQRKHQPKPESTNPEVRLTAAKSSPAPQRKSQPKPETSNGGAGPAAAKSSPAPQRKTQPQPKLETSVAEGGPTAAKSSSAPKPVDGAAGKAVRSAVRSVLDAAKQFLGVDTPAPRREGSRSPARGAQPPAPAPSPAAARRRRARARRRAAATTTATATITGAPPAASAAPAAPLDWAAEVEAELPLDEDGDEDEAAAPPTPGGRRKRKRHRRKRGAAPAPTAPAPPPVATATAAPTAPPAPVKRLKSCEEDSGDAAGGSRPVSARSPDRASAATDDDLTPWSVVRTRRQRRRLRRDRKSRSADGGGGGEGFRFQDPARALRLSSGSSEAGGGGGAHVFYFAGGGGDAR